MRVLFRFITMQFLHYQAQNANTEILHYIYKMYLTAVFFPGATLGKVLGFVNAIHTRLFSFLLSMLLWEFLKNL